MVQWISNHYTNNYAEKSWSNFFQILKFRVWQNIHCNGMTPETVASINDYIDGNSRLIHSYLPLSMNYIDRLESPVDKLGMYACMPISDNFPVGPFKNHVIFQVAHFIMSSFRRTPRLLGRHFQKFDSPHPWMSCNVTPSQVHMPLPDKFVHALEISATPLFPNEQTFRLCAVDATFQITQFLSRRNPLVHYPGSDCSGIVFSEAIY